MTNCSNHINDIIVEFNFKWNGHKRCIHKETQSATNECPTQQMLSKLRQMGTYNTPAENGIPVPTEVILQGSSCIQAHLLRKRGENQVRGTSLVCDNILLCKGWLVLPLPKYPDKEKRIWQLSEQHFIRSASAKINKRQAEGLENAWKAGTSNTAPSQSLCLCRTCLLSPSHSKCQTYLF